MDQQVPSRWDTPSPTADLSKFGRKNFSQPVHSLSTRNRVVGGVARGKDSGEDKIVGDFGRGRGRRKNKGKKRGRNK